MHLPSLALQTPDNQVTLDNTAGKFRWFDPRFAQLIRAYQPTELEQLFMLADWFSETGDGEQKEFVRSAAAAVRFAHAQTTSSADIAQVLSNPLFYGAHFDLLSDLSCAPRPELRSSLETLVHTHPDADLVSVAYDALTKLVDPNTLNVPVLRSNRARAQPDRFAVGYMLFTHHQLSNEHFSTLTQYLEELLDGYLDYFTASGTTHNTRMALLSADVNKRPLQRLAQVPEFAFLLDKYCILAPENASKYVHSRDSHSLIRSLQRRITEHFEDRAKYSSKTIIFEV